MKVNSFDEMSTARAKTSAPNLAIFALAFIALSMGQAHAAAPLRAGQPYAEAICNTDPNVIFCEDFNYPQNIVRGLDGTSSNSNWINPGLTTGLFGFIYGIQALQINPATNYPTKPTGMMPSGTQPDYVYAANWDPSKGPTGSGSLWGKLRESGGNYANGSPPSTDLYFRFQYYVTANYTWAGDPKTDKYNYGSAGQCYDNKILYVYPPEGPDNPTNAAYDAGLHTQCAVYDPTNNARYADAIAVRYGDTSDNYKFFPMCSSCNVNQYYNYAPFQCSANTAACWRNPHDTPQLGRVFRFDTNRWYTVEMRYKLGSGPGVADGVIEIWIDGTKIYSQSGLATCGFGGGDCSGIGAIDLVAYHNMLDPTVWNGQQIIDNLVISRAYIGPPKSGASGSTGSTPSAPGAPLLQ